VSTSTTTRALGGIREIEGVPPEGGSMYLTTENEQGQTDKRQADATTEMVLVPRKPTAEMLEAAWASALNEDAQGVWNSMIQAWLNSSSGKSVSGSD
jgi:hypothetical protein